MKSIYRFVTSIALLINSCLSGEIQQSIIPLIEHVEVLSNLRKEKYSEGQFQDIATALHHQADRLRVMSYNVLFDLYDADLDEADRWPQRLPRVVELLQEAQPDIVGVQEMRPNQLMDLLPHLGATFGFFGPDDQKAFLDGIFFRKDRFEPIQGKVWNMPQSAKSSSTATLTMLQLKDLQTKEVFAVFNAHLSFSHVNLREVQARFIEKQIASVASEMPAILTGDFNTFPNRVDLEKLPFLDGDYIERILTQRVLKDAKDVALLGHLGPLSSFSNGADTVAPFKGLGTPGVFLDHIFVSPGMAVLIHAVQAAQVNGHFPSDHFPLIIDVLIDGLPER